MKIFKNKILIKIIVSICIFLTIINFPGCNSVYAAEEQVWGGILIKPVTRLLTAISDGIISILQKSILEQDPSIIKISGSPEWWNDWGFKALFVIVTLVIMVVGGLILATTGGILTIVAVGVIEIMLLSYTGQDGASHIAEYIVEAKANEWFDEDIYLPAFVLSPEEIFSNKLLLFDVNFFKAKTKLDFSSLNDTGILYDSGMFRQMYWNESGDLVPTNRFTNFSALDDKVNQYNGQKLNMWDPNNGDEYEDEGETALWNALETAGIMYRNDWSAGGEYLFEGQSYNKFKLEFDKIVEDGRYTHNIYIYEGNSGQAKWLVSYISLYDPYGDSEYIYQLVVAEWKKYNAYISGKEPGVLYDSEAFREKYKDEAGKLATTNRFTRFNALDDKVNEYAGEERR